MAGASETIHVRYLAERPEALPTLVAWFEDEWEPYYGPNGPGDARSDLSGSMNRDHLPICLVALDDGGALLGTISLKSTSISHPELGSWGATSLVAPGMRRRGVGTVLVRPLENEAARLGFEKLYKSTDAANGIVKNVVGKPSTLRSHCGGRSRSTSSTRLVLAVTNGTERRPARSRWPASDR